MANPIFGSELRNYLRLGNMFLPNREEKEEDEFDPTARMSQLYNPETRMSDRYDTALSSFPQREPPGMMRKIAASLSALSGDPRLVENSLYGDYDRKVKDWQTQIEPLSAAANLERGNNNNMRMIANQILSQEMGDRRLQRQLRRDTVLERQGNIRLRETSERNDVLARNAEEAGKRANTRLEIANKVARGGVLNVDDAGNARIVYKDGSVEPVDGTYLTFQEKEQAKATNKQPRVVERTIEYPPGSGKAVRMSVNLDTGDATPIVVKEPGKEPTKAGVVKNESAATRELGEQRGVVNKANRLKAQDPELGRFIIIKNGRFEGIKAGVLGIGGPTEEQRKRIGQILYGDENAFTEADKETTREDGKVHVRRKSDGKTGWVTNPDLEKYERIP